jgi:NADP-dependent 3-hydroxy acid dehydrogenase YdfG
VSSDQPGTNGTRTVIVSGGTGFVGGIAVRALLAAGWTVIVPGRDPGRLGALVTGADAANLHTALTPGPPDPRRWAAAVAAVVGAADLRPSAVVAALGGWRLTPDLLDTDPDDWQRILGTHLTSHLVAAQAYAPLIADHPDAAYVALNGAASVDPFADAGGISVTGAAQRMLVDVLRVGRLADRVRFTELVLMAAIAGDDRNVDPAEQLTADQVGHALLDLLADRNAPAHRTVGPTGTR